MTTILQLNPPFHIWVPESEDFGLALFLIDYHVEEHLYWVCAMEKTGEVWTLSNDKIRMDTNRSIGRVYEKRRRAPTVSEEHREFAERGRIAIQKLIRHSFPEHHSLWKRVDAPTRTGAEAIRRKDPHRATNRRRIKSKKRA